MLNTLEQLEKQIQKNDLNGIYLLYGEEKYILETTLKKIKKIFGILLPGINYIIINETNINTLIDNIETPAFGYEKKMILVKDINLFSNTNVKKTTKSKAKINTSNQEDFLLKLNQYIIENTEYINDKVLLIFVQENINKNNELFLTIEKLGNVCEFEKLNPTQIVKKIKKICIAYNVNIDDETLKYFIETCGTEMQNLINEIRKLIEYVGENGKIKKEDINKLSIKSLDSIIFDLTDNLGNKKTKEALNILHELIINKEPVQKILITLYNHFKKIYLLILANKYNKDIKEVLQLKPNQTFLIYKYKKQAEYFKEKELRKILEELINLDSNNKIGLIDLNIGLEAILATYFS